MTARDHTRRPAVDSAARADSVSALARGFRVLHSFAPGVAALSHQQIMRATGLPKATVSRVTQTLVGLGYLDASHADGRFRLTAKTLDVGRIYLSNVDVRAIAQPLMAELAEYTRATVNLGVRSGDHIVVVETCRTDATVISVNVNIGFQFPILQTAIGRAYIAGLAPGARAAAVKALRPTAAAHEWKALQVRVAEAALGYDTHGFCAMWGEWRQGVNSVAAPIRTGLDGEPYVINCAGPAPHLDPALLATEAGPRLVHIVREVERAVNVSWQQGSS